MGQTVSAAKEEAKKQAQVDEKMANDALNSLLDLAEANNKVFDATVATGGQSDKTVGAFSLVTCCPLDIYSVCNKHYSVTAAGPHHLH
jgi:hypothetical protein